MAKRKSKAPTGPKRTWQIQTEPSEALPALILRYLSPGRAIPFTKLFGMVWDDLVGCAFWTHERLGHQPKVFMHGLGLARMDRRRQVVREYMRAALTALMEAGVIGRSASSYRLASYDARTDWLAARPPALLEVYRGLAMTHDGWDGAMKGLERFDREGKLKDPRNEEIRQLKLERDRLTINLAEARGLLKTYQEAVTKRRALQQGVEG